MKGNRSMVREAKGIAVLLILAFLAAGCGRGSDGRLPVGEPEEAAGEGTEQESVPEEEAESEESVGYADGEDTEISPEQMDFIKFNYYVELNNDIIDILDDINYYYEVVDYTEEFSLLPDSGLTYGYRIYGKNVDTLEDCLLLADMEPDYGELDELVKEMAEPLRNLMVAFSDISGSNDYADNQYQKAKEYHEVIYRDAELFGPLGYEYLDAIAQMGDARTAEEEAKMKEDGLLIIYNASRGISIGRQVLDEIYSQGITDENITQMDLTRIKELYDELVAVVSDFDAATADNDQLIKESISNSRPFDGLYDALIQALEWMIKQVESGQPLDLSGSGAPLGSIGHFSETLSKCVDRYNSVFVD